MNNGMSIERVPRGGHNNGSRNGKTIPSDLTPQLRCQIIEFSRERGT